MSEGICVICGKKTQIRAKGMCSKCYHRMYYHANREHRLKQMRRYRQQKCPICGKRKKIEDEVCEDCKKRYFKYMAGLLENFERKGVYRGRR